jgi:uncharacterized protein with PIN domain
MGFPYHGSEIERRGLMEPTIKKVQRTWICFECDKYNKPEAAQCAKCNAPMRKALHEMTPSQFQEEQFALANKYRAIKEDMGGMLSEMKSLTGEEVAQKFGKNNVGRTWVNKRWELEKIRMRREELGI